MKGQSDRLTANPLVVLREEFDDWAVLFDPDTGNAFGLNPVGVLVWKLLDGKHSPRDILAEVQRACRDVPEDAADHLQEFLSSLAERGLAGHESSSSN